MPRLRTNRLLAFSAAVVASLSFSSCGSSKKGGTNPVAASTPAPVPGTLAPAPTPSPTTPPGGAQGASCAKLSNGTGGDRDCHYESGRVYDGALATAMSGVNPQYMNGNEIVNYAGFRDDIVKSLDSHGICAVFESDNLFVRGVGDSFNEYYDVITSDGFSSRRYTNTCRPPVATPEAPPPPPVRDATCKLPPSLETICIKGTPTFGGQVRDSLEDVVAEERARGTSAIFNFNDVLPGTSDGWKVKDADAYHAAVIRKLQGRGFCAWYDGEEIQMKNSNQFSEHWDLYKAEGYRIQLFAGICRDAAF